MRHTDRCLCINLYDRAQVRVSPCSHWQGKKPTMGSKHRGASSVEVEVMCTYSTDSRECACQHVYTHCRLYHMLKQYASITITCLSMFNKTCRASTGTVSCTYKMTSRTLTPTSCCRGLRQSGMTQSGACSSIFTCRQAAAPTAEPTKGLHIIGMRSADHSQQGPRKTTRLCDMWFNLCMQYMCTH